MTKDPTRRRAAATIAGVTLAAAAPLPVAAQEANAKPPAAKKAPRPSVMGSARKNFGDFAPALAAYTDDVVLGDLWKRPGLPLRDRSLITVTTLIALYRVNELPFHLKYALENGVTRDELLEVITHMAFYSGWPTASTAMNIARKAFEEVDA